MDNYFPDGNKTSSFTPYGYAVYNTLLHVFKSSDGDYSRKNFMKQAANIKQLRVPMLLPGITIDISATDFFPIESLGLA